MLLVPPCPSNRGKITSRQPSRLKRDKCKAGLHPSSWTSGARGRREFYVARKNFAGFLRSVENFFPQYVKIGEGSGCRPGLHPRRDFATRTRVADNGEREGGLNIQCPITNFQCPSEEVVRGRGGRRRGVRLRKPSGRGGGRPIGGRVARGGRPNRRGRAPRSAGGAS